MRLLLFSPRPERRKELADYQGFLLYRDIEAEWVDCRQYFDFLQGRMLFNYAQLVGHGTLRVNAAGFSERISREQMQDMTRLLEESLDAGCFGLSSGLMYMPGTFAATEELVALARVAKRHPNAFYASHLRGYSATFLEAVKEIIQVGREVGLPVQVSHLGPFGVKNGYKIQKAIELMEKARQEGIDVAYDSLGYCGSDTLAIALFPPSAYSRGLDRFLEDIRDDSFWNALSGRLRAYVPQWPSWEGNGWTDNFVECCGIERIYGSGFPPVLHSSARASCRSLSGMSCVGGAAPGSWRTGGLQEESSSMASAGSFTPAPNSRSFDAVDRAPLCINSVDEVFHRSGRSSLEAWGSFPTSSERYVKERKTPLSD